MSSPNLAEMNHSFVIFFSELFSLLFPKLCLGCHKELKGVNKCLCFACELGLPQSFEDGLGVSKAMNSLELPIPLKHAFSLYFFEKNNLVEKLLYHLKYMGNRQVGVFFGRKMASLIAKSGCHYDGIIGVPLHVKRKRKRGFNQVDIIGQSVEKVLGIPYHGSLLRRIKNTPPLSKRKGDRKQIVDKAFKLSAPESLLPGHYLLLDDIFTSGTTLEACGKTLLTQKAIRLSIATVAYRN